MNSVDDAPIESNMRLLPSINPQNRSPPQNRHRGKGDAFLFRPIVVLLFYVLAVRLASGDDPATPAAENVLRHVKGLSKIPGGKVWLCRAERTLRGCLASLDDAKREVIQLQKSLDQRLQQNHQQWEANRQAIAALKTALSQTSTDAPERKQLEKQIRQLESQAIDPDRLAAQGDIRTRLIQFTNARGSLALQLLAIRRSILQMEVDYRNLGADLEVRAALRKLGEGHRLGPLESYRDEQSRLDEYERLAFTSWLPVYLQSDRIRVGGILNETTPITFTWRPESGPTVLTTAMVESAGLEMPAADTAVPLPVAPGRTLAARRMTVPALRFGQTVLRDLQVHVLGPEGEDLGAMIGPDAFAEQAVTLELDRLRLVIRAK